MLIVRRGKKKFGVSATFNGVRTDSQITEDCSENIFGNFPKCFERVTSAWWIILRVYIFSEENWLFIMRISVAVLWILGSCFGELSEESMIATRTFARAAILSLNCNLKFRCIIINSSINDLIIALSFRNQFIKWFIESINSKIKCNRRNRAQAIAPCKEEVKKSRIGENLQVSLIGNWKEKWRKNHFLWRLQTPVSHLLANKTKMGEKKLIFLEKTTSWELIAAE